MKPVDIEPRVKVCQWPSSIYPRPEEKRETVEIDTYHTSLLFAHEPALWRACPCTSVVMCWRVVSG